MNTPDLFIGGVSVAALFGILYAIIKLLRHARSEYKAQLVVEENQQEEREQRRKREASAELWEVLDMKQEEIDRLMKRIDEVEKKCNDAIDRCEQERRACERDLAFTRGRLEIIEEWAKSKGMKIPPMQHIRPVIDPQTGSGPHTPLQGPNT